MSSNESPKLLILPRLLAQLKFITSPLLHLDTFEGGCISKPKLCFFLEMFNFSFPYTVEGGECFPQH